MPGSRYCQRGRGEKKKKNQRRRQPRCVEKRNRKSKSKSRCSQFQACPVLFRPRFVFDSRLHRKCQKCPKCPKCPICPMSKIAMMCPSSKITLNGGSGIKTKCSNVPKNSKAGTARLLSLCVWSRVSTASALPQQYLMARLQPHLRLLQQLRVRLGKHAL